MGLPAPVFQLTTVILSAVLSSTIRKSRLINLVLIFLLALAGILMVKLLPQHEKLSRLAGFWLVTASAPAFPLMLSLAASNVAGFTKKSTVMAMIFLAYCAGNLAGPQFFKSSEAPNYHVCIPKLIETCAYTNVSFSRLPIRQSSFAMPLLLLWSLASDST